MPELGRLKAASERVAVARGKLVTFVERFNGPLPESASANPPVADSYRNDLDSLFEQIDRLESIVGALDSIG
jgi:hypothetical protein